MRGGFWPRLLVGLITAVIGAGFAWAGYALMAPQKAGLKMLPAAVNMLPFDRMFWAIALMGLGGATLLHALPHPFWTKSNRRRSPMAPLNNVDDLAGLPPAPDPQIAPDTDHALAPAPNLHSDAALEASDPVPFT